MLFGLGHHQFCGLIRIVLVAVPVNDHTVDAAADHICDLAVNLDGIVGTVSYVDVTRISPPWH
jgi:hypothetical protein